MIQQFYCRRNDDIYPHKDLYISVYGRFIHNGQQPNAQHLVNGETNCNTFINRLLHSNEKDETMVHTQHG